MSAAVPEPTVELLRRLAPHAPLVLRPVLANAGRLGPVLARALIAAGPETAAMTRTTFAVTTLSGSPALNVVAALKLAKELGPGKVVATVAIDSGLKYLNGDLFVE